MHTPSESEFLKLSQQGNLIPVYQEMLGDLETPVAVYLKITRKARHAFLLESVEGEERIARYSFLAKDPELILQTKNNMVKITRFKKGKKPVSTSYPLKDTPLTVIKEILGKYRFVPSDGLPRFCGGLVGYLGYDLVRFFEKLPRNTRDDLKLPDTYLMLATRLIIFDHLNHTIKIVCCQEVDGSLTKNKKRALYQNALKEISKLSRELRKPLSLPQNKNRRTKDFPLESVLSSNLAKDEFIKIVAKAKEYIRSGDIIQVVLSQRFKIPLTSHPFNVYRSLRALNPSAYMFYLNFDQIQLIGSSPELLVRSEDGIVETRPIAGTRPRGKNDQEDELLARELLNDAKEKAEHIMLVDLGRNDLGRVCKKGSVHVTDFMRIEKYSHVIHIVSDVKGELQKGYNALDVLRAAFPAGTVSGAPKIRAMAIIEELEDVRRGPYAGCIGYFSFSGNLDTCITIRTIVVNKGNAYIQAGAGIVADSDPAKEYQETLNKAKAPLLALEMAQKII